MNLTQLRYFCTIVDLMSFSKAADALFVSQSALSRSISALESDLKCELFLRQGKRLSLTRSGEVLLPYAREMVAFFDAKEHEIQTKLGLSNEKLTIGIPPTAGAVFFHKVVKKFQQAYPDTELIIEEGASKSVLRKIRNMTQDLGIIIGKAMDDNIAQFPVLTSTAVAIVNTDHYLANRNEVSFGDLKDEQFVVISSDFIFHDQVVDRCKQAGFVPDIKFESPHWEWLFQMVQANEGITILPYPLVKDFKTDKLCYLKLKEPEFPWTLSVIWNKNAILSSATRLFIDLCKKEAQICDVLREQNGSNEN